MSSTPHSFGHFSWERKGQVTAPGPGKVKVYLKAQAEVCSAGAFTLANKLVEKCLRKESSPTKDVTIYMFCFVFFPCSNHNSLLLVRACKKMQ